MSLFKEVTVSHIKEEVKGVKSFIFEDISENEIPYKAGQYLTFALTKPFKEIRRSYSITSTPTLNEPLSVAVKRIKNGLFSRYLYDQVKIGDKLLTTGAAGFFTLPEDISTYDQIFFFAAGNGITPIFSLIKTVLFAHPEISITLIYSNRSTETTMFLENLTKLEKDFPDRFKIEWLFSTSPNLAKARLYKDLLKALVMQYAVTTPNRMLAFLCGPENYMRMCTYGLRQLNVPVKNIRKELFTSARAIPKIKPPDTKKHSVIIRLNRKEHRLAVQYPNTILHAAKKEGIILPYSCEVGRCGNCTAQCLQGEVWMSYNEVLTKKEIDKGLVLTCVGYPIGGDVVLRIEAD